jgi:RNA polymerase sigma-70 factor (ECF subfamily)
VFVTKRVGRRLLSAEVDGPGAPASPEERIDAVPRGTHQPAEAGAPAQGGFEDAFVALFGREFPRLFRYLDRLTGEPELAADLAQDALLRLYRRGELPDSPRAWLVAAAMNLLRNARSTRSRRMRLLTPERAGHAHADPTPAPGEGIDAEATRRRVRAAIDGLSERERKLLLLHAEGYRYREIAAALDLNEASVGTLLARAKRAFRERLEEHADAP